MKLIFKIFTVIAVASIVSVSGCKKVLDEEPRDRLTKEFFSTADGIEGGVAAGYSDLRNQWGVENFMNMFCGGTDEVLAGGSNNNQHWFTYAPIITSRTEETGIAWNTWYEIINTMNGVLQFGPDAEMDAGKKAQLMAQALFLRAFCYYHLVTTFGDVPLHLEFVTESSSADSRAPIAEVYTQIIKDLTDAAAALPNQPAANTGKPAFKATALYLLSKTYLARGWSSAAAPTDFTNAYNTAKSVIDAKATYGLDLWPNFGDVNRKGNEYGRETLMVIDHNADTKYGEYTLNQAAAGAKENKSNFYFRPNYPTVTANYPATGGNPVCIRDIANGRPFIRIRPNYNYTMLVAFPAAGRATDYRYDRTFQTHWMSNVSGVITPRGTLVPGVDTAIWMPDRLVTPAERAAFKGIIFEPPIPGATTPYTSVIYPSMRKYDDSTRPNLNDASTRPYILFKFSELYLIAAEAAFKSNDKANAAAMINVLRRRAAARPGQTTAEYNNALTAQTITANDVTLDFILDERSRELWGESLRWWDLVRTQTLVTRVKQYNSEAAANVKAEFMLKPIPLTSQIDRVTEGPKFPQNPGY